MVRRRQPSVSEPGVARAEGIAHKIIPPKKSSIKKYHKEYKLGDAFVLAFCCLYYLGDTFGPGYSGLVTLGFCYAKNQTLRIPIAFFYFVNYNLSDAFQVCFIFIWARP